MKRTETNMTANPHPIGEKIYEPLDLAKLVGPRGYFYADGTLIFWSEEEQKYVIARISEEKAYSAEQYLQLPEGAPFQLVNKKLTYMSAPFDRHQEILGEIFVIVRAHVKKHNLGKVRLAPLNVKLDEGNVFQPDLLFVSVSREEIMGKRFVSGAPDWIAEILSHSTEWRDRNEKKEAYAKHGVREYWLVHPEEEWIEVYALRDGTLELQGRHEKGGSFASEAIEGLRLDLDELF